MKRNLLLTIAYDGSGFHGWQEQKNLRTVQGVLQDALSGVLREEIHISGTSRTDTGVHARGQCASFFTSSAIPTERLPLAVNHVLAGGRNGNVPKVPDVLVREAREVPPAFHPRFACRGKTYVYRIRTGEPDIFKRHYSYFIGQMPDMDAMREGAAYLIGTHDFAAFQNAGGTPRKTTVRTIRDIRVEPSGQEELLITVTGDGFLYNMVRILVGTLLEVGTGRRAPQDVLTALTSLKRENAGHTAPPEGLYLEKIYFDETAD